MPGEQQTLHRGLEERHINLMALGATIGVGLFLGSATAIKMAGPAIMLAYGIGGLAIFMIMRALGEMAIHNPVAGSFSRYAQDYLGPLAGYLTGWNYWFLWLVTCMAEITAVGVYMGIWFPDVPSWYWVLAAMLAMGGVNLIAVKAYGEFEFWFALIKIVTIVLMIAGGFAMIIFGFGNHGVATGIANLWAHGGFMPHGFSGVLMSLQMVMFAYLGVEMLGLTAGEAKNPKKALARAVDSVFWRILIFYIGALFVILSIYPWNELGTRGSPFVMTFESLGIPAAAGIINFVVLTAALSSCNSGIYSTGRMLFNLAEQKQALPLFAKVSKSGVPLPALLLSIAALLLGVLLNYLAPKEVFTWLTAISTFGAVWTWLIILLAQLRFRRSLSAEQLAGISHRMPLWPYGSYLTLGFLALVIALMAYFPDTRVALIVGPGWLVFLVAVYYLLGYHKQDAAWRLAQQGR
ncbi:amino acid permease [Chromobacterium subtsugae]|uniref:Amino acid permease n=1 Tax=Chromobacterium subtsugae TaxID=251747 RepID=A0ABS7FI41_9NEIS|nr:MULTISPECIES: amino acid permease [Chromobacterium]KUM02668.1 D-alanine/D-serine/glycine permease [Chromobacterium subtsugae]KZE85362.1 D-alanine/D-serine/glycine permease [Chromobacterium sp. F49]MBW7568784.1 amino acid permease [Chromobacterium subtsugae]MBW8289739.1 amino acid permease [Chromobacterium subtsugae]OBU85109.1 D-alanine/D-serine/glycine permease [Chromobacterium subtsugae]